MEDNNDKILEGQIKYKITLTEDDLNVSFEQSNENNLVSFIAVQQMYNELWNQQMAPGTPATKMSKGELKELQISMNFLRSHIALLGSFVKTKYKDAMFTKDKPKIDIIDPTSRAVPKNLKGL